MAKKTVATLHTGKMDGALRPVLIFLMSKWFRTKP